MQTISKFVASLGCALLAIAFSGTAMYLRKIIARRSDMTPEDMVILPLCMIFMAIASARLAYKLWLQTLAQAQENYESHVHEMSQLHR